MSEGIDIGTLSGRIELEDRLTNVLDHVGGAIGKFESSWSHMGQHMLDNTASFFTAEAALHAVEKALEIAKEKFEELTIGGAKVADVEQNFERLNEQAGRVGATLLGTLHEATHNTITDFELMKSVNADMAAGMKLTDDQYKTLAQGAFSLAQATGVTVKEAFDRMSDAMLTGRVRAVQLLTGKIDLAAAEQDYAKKLGTTVDHLTAEGKMEADREAILKKVGDATKRLGEQTDGLDEKVEQMQVAWQNFEEDLGKTIATSPVVMAGLNGISEALSEAFGGNKEQLIQNIVHSIEDASIKAIDFAEYVVDGAAIVAREWHALMVVIDMAKQGWMGIDYVLGEIFLTMEKIANFALAGALDEQVKATTKYLEDEYTKMAELENAIREHKKAEDDWAVSTGHVNEALEKIKKRMEDARAAAAETKPHVEALAGATQHVADAANAHAAANEKENLVMAKTAEEAKKALEAQKEIEASGKTWKETLSGINVETAKAVKTYLEAGVSQDKLAAAYGLTATQVTALSKSLKEEQDATKLATKAANDSAERWTQYYSMIKEMSGTTTDATIADVERWKAAQIKSHKDAKTDTADFYDWLGKMEAAQYEKADKARLEQDTHSKAHFEKIARDADDAYKFAASHADQFTAEYIAGLARTRDAASETAKHWKDTIGGELGKETEQAKALAAQLRAMGGSQEVTSQNFQQSIMNLITNGGWNPSGMGSNIDMNEAMRLAKLGYSFQEIKNIFDRKKNGATGPIPPPQGPKIPGFREGGYGDFGDGTIVELHGKEVITPVDKLGGAMGGVVVNQYINGTAADVARQVSVELMRTLKQFKQFGSAT